MNLRSALKDWCDQARIPMQDRADGVLASALLDARQTLLFELRATAGVLFLRAPLSVPDADPPTMARLYRDLLTANRLRVPLNGAWFAIDGDSQSVELLYRIEPDQLATDADCIDRAVAAINGAIHHAVRHLGLGYGQT